MPKRSRSGVVSRPCRVVAPTRVNLGRSIRTEGEAKMWQYTGESGNTADFFFCPTCGSGVWYRARPYHDAYAVPLGNFEPGHGFDLQFSVYEERQEPWVSISGDAIERHD